VLEARDDLGFATESTAPVLGDEIEARREDFQRDSPRDARVLGEEDGPLSAATDLREEPVRSDPRFRDCGMRLGCGRVDSVRRRSLQREVLASDGVLATRVAREVVGERELSPLVAVRQEFVDEIEDVRRFGVSAGVHERRL
jgi:hypothetical protein